MDETGVRLRRIRLGVFAAALALYGFAGSPTPDHPGWTEALIGAGLIVAAGFGGFLHALDFSPQRPPWVWAGRALLLFGLTVGLIQGMLRGHDLALIARDIIPFMFLLLPLFLAPAFRDERDIFFCLAGVLAIGILFSCRVLAPVFHLAPVPQELLYLANAPTVLFTALYLGGLVWVGLSGNLTFLSFLKILIIAAIVVIPLAAVMINVQRATVSAVILTFALLAFLTFIKNPGRVVLPLLVLTAAALFSYDAVSESLYSIARKTAQVGWNMRLQELQAVLDAGGGSLGTALFGLGWGATFASPAVAGTEVAYTHSLLTYMFLKTGLAGLTLTAAYIGLILWHLMRAAGRDTALVLSLLWPILIPVTLYASHKSLDFGLVLALAVLTGATRGVASPNRLV